MFPSLLEDYKNTTFRSLARSVILDPVFADKKFPFMAVMDASIIHFKPWLNIVFNPKAKTGWRLFLEKYHASEKYRKLNNIVNGNPLLSRYVTVAFINSIIKELKNQSQKLGWKEENTIKALNTPFSNLNANEGKVVNQIIDALHISSDNETKELIEDVETISSFSHIGIPVATLLEKPDEFRKKARNRIIVNLVRFLNRLRNAPDIRQTKAPTLVGGRPLGIKTIQRFSELSRVLPIELIDDSIFEFKVSSRTLRVSEQYGSIRNYVVYLDKSGSMADSIPCKTISGVEYIPKISFAAASVLTLASKLKNIGAKLTLHFFDVDVHDPVSNFAQIIDLLLKIKADSGTNVSLVLENALKYRDEKIIIITDGIDVIDEDACKKAKAKSLDVSCVLIKTDNPLLKKYFNTVRVEDAKPEVILSL